MIRNILWVAAALVCSFAFGASNVEAGIFHHKKDCCAPVCEPVCPPPCAPVCPPPCPKLVPVCVEICDPCTGCPKMIEVCVPECCAAECPKKDYRCALIGKGVYTFTWCSCDHVVKVRVFKDGHYTVKD